MFKKISILGSTGSIGTQTLEIVRENSTELKVVALAAGSNIELLEKQIREFKPEIVCVWDGERAGELKIKVSDCNVKVVSGMQGLIECAAYKEAEVTVTAVVGMIGIIPTIEAIKAGKDIALANKETLVTAGHIIMPLVEQYKVKLLPVDSEHSAIFQSIGSNRSEDIEKLILTASGGPFRGKKTEELMNIRPEDALKHPNWAMGRKITIDSSTMINKGLEVMEARWLFNIPTDKIEVVIQPQSILHSAVSFVDGGVIGQFGKPDMKLPILYALFYPERRFMKADRLDLFELGKITFEKPDYETFYGLKLAFDAAEKGGSMPTVYNASNEYAVSLFLSGKIKYLQIPELIKEAMKAHNVIQNPDVDAILRTEKEAYEFIDSVLK